MERGLVLDAVAGDAAGEVEQRFFLVDVVDGFRDGGDGEELAVGVDVVVLALVGGVGGGVFDLIGGAGGAGSEALGLVAGVAVDGVEQELLVLGEVLIEGERCVERDDGDDVGGLHLFVDVVAGCVLRPLEVFGLHGGDVEEEDDEAVVAECVTGHDGRFAEEDGVSSVATYRRFVERGGFVDAFVVEAGDLLGFAVFGDGEVFLR